MSELIEEGMKANELITKCMDLASFPGLTEEFIMETTLMTKKMVSENLCGRMAENMWGIERMENSSEKDKFLMQKET